MSEEIQDISEELKSLLTEHSYYKRYEESSVVTHTTGDSINFYKAIKNVPRYISINNKSYWKKLNKKTNAGESPTPAFDNDFIPIYFPPELEPIPMYQVEAYNNLFVTIIIAYYVIPNQTTQPEITGIKINNVSYTLVSLEGDNDEPAPGIAVIGHCEAIPINEQMYEELQYMKQMGVDINANIGDSLLVVDIGAFSDTALSGPITFELNTDSGNCTIVIPEYVEPQPIAYIYVLCEYGGNQYGIYSNTGNYHSTSIDGDWYTFSFLDTTIGSTFQIKISGGFACTGWQESSDGETWTDIPNSATNELEVTIKEGTTYYRPIVVSTEPDWVEISSELDTESTRCELDSWGVNTGICNRNWIIVKEDQNVYSSTYQQTIESTVSNTYADTDACPISQIVETPITINVYTEYDDNGTIITNDYTKATYNIGLYRWDDNYRHVGFYTANNNCYTLAKRMSVDESIEIYVNIECSDNVAIKSIKTRQSENDSWNTEYDCYANSNPIVYINRYQYPTTVTSNPSSFYLDVKVELIQTI